jgi:hypothetical protein
MCLFSKRPNCLGDQVSATNTSLISHSCSQPIITWLTACSYAPDYHLPWISSRAEPRSGLPACGFSRTVQPCEGLHSGNKRLPNRKSYQHVQSPTGKHLGGSSVSTRENPCGRSSTAIHETYEAHIRECGVTQAVVLAASPYFGSPMGINRLCTTVANSMQGARD